uniref:Uncharacterized protein n=1 Tax=Rhizophora mucronata TaxID=61149 RepID=A0A2P2KYP8_RHIMU
MQHMFKMVQSHCHYFTIHFCTIILGRNAGWLAFCLIYVAINSHMKATGTLYCILKTS